MRSYPADAAVAPEPERLRGGKGGYSCASAWDGYRSVLDASSYCTGYCTWFVWQKRPEQQLKNLGNAWEWYGGAKARGIPIGGDPVVGAVAWWGISAHAPEGHVAYVVGATASTVTVEEMNRVAWNVADTRTISLRSSEAPTGYIYGGPAGSGPRSGGGSSGGGSGSSGGGGGTTGEAGSGTPATLYNGGEKVYFRGANGDLMEFAWGAPTNPLDLGHQMQGTPAVFYDPANGEEEIYYEGVNGDLDMSWWKGGSLGFLDLGIKTTASPAAMYDGNEEVYFRGANGDLMEFAWGAPTNPLDLGHQMQGTPAVFYDPNNGEEEIYYEGATGELDMSWWKGGNLGFLELGTQTRSSPAALLNSGDGQEETYFCGPNGHLTEGYWGSGYQFLDLGAGF
jgi:surface antigen